MAVKEWLEKIPSEEIQHMPHKVFNEHVDNHRMVLCDRNNSENNYNYNCPKMDDDLHNSCCNCCHRGFWWVRKSEE